MINTENRVDPFKRRGSRFLKRKELVISLWEEGKHEEALEATGHRYAKTIYELVVKKEPPSSISQIARVINRSRSMVYHEISIMKEIGVSFESES